MKYILLITLMLTLSMKEIAGSSSKMPEREILRILKQITKNHPELSKDYAMRVAGTVYKVHKKYGIPYDIYTAILMQESRYKLAAKGCTKTACQDFGISQVNIVTARTMKINTKRLTTDLDYSVTSGAIVLKDFMNRYSHKEHNWWSRYNSSNKAKRKEYERKVRRFLP